MTPPLPSRFALLAALGVLQGCPDGAAGPDPVSPPLEQAEGLAAEKAWTACLQTWQEGAEAAYGPDPHPFTEKEKAKLMARIDKTRGKLEGLRRRDLLTEAEAGLLDQDVTTLLVDVDAKRPKEMELSTCYQPMLHAPRQEALGSLAPRVALIEAMAAQQVLQPEVVTRVLERVRSDLVKLQTPGGPPLTAEQQAEADEVGRRVEAALARIDQRGPTPSNDESDQGEVTIDPIDTIPEAGTPE